MKSKPFGLHGKADGAEHTDNTEDSSGKANEQMSRTMNYNVDKVCDSCSYQ